MSGWNDWDEADCFMAEDDWNKYWRDAVGEYGPEAADMAQADRDDFVRSLWKANELVQEGKGKEAIKLVRDFPDDLILNMAYETGDCADFIAYFEQKLKQDELDFKAAEKVRKLKKQADELYAILDQHIPGRNAQQTGVAL